MGDITGLGLNKGIKEELLYSCYYCGEGANLEKIRSVTCFVLVYTSCYKWFCDKCSELIKQQTPEDKFKDSFIFGECFHYVEDNERRAGTLHS